MIKIKNIQDALDTKLNSTDFSYTGLLNVPTEFVPISHGHDMTNITGLQSSLNLKLDSSSFIYSGLSGIPETFQPSLHTHPISGINNLQDSLNLKANLSLVSAPSGIASLDAGGKVPSSQLPSYVDDVLEYANFATLPVTGTSGIIYVTLDDNLTFRWSGSAYVEISKSLALGATSSTAFRGDYGSAAYAHISATGNPHSTSKADVGLSNVDNTSDAGKPVSTAQQTALNLKADSSTLSSHTGNTSNPHTVTKTQVGLGNADNTSDVNKPISTATQTALDLKATDSLVVKLSGVQTIAGHKSFSDITTLKDVEFSEPVLTVQDVATVFSGTNAVIVMPLIGNVVHIVAGDYNYINSVSNVQVGAIYYLVNKTGASFLIVHSVGANICRSASDILLGVNESVTAIGLSPTSISVH